MKTMPKTNGNKGASRFIMRPYRRIPTWYLTYYMGRDLVGKGVVTNLSCTGMRVLGDHAMQRGASLALRLTTEEDGPPLEIDRATVRWVKEAEFGVHIVTITRAGAKRIAKILASQAGTRYEKS